MKITFDPDANAIYVRLTPENLSDLGETDVNEDGVIIDTYADGSPRGYEFLAVRNVDPRRGSLPESVERALDDFIAAGSLASSTFVEREYLP